MLGEGFSMGWGEGFLWAGRIFFVGWRSFSGGRRFSCLFSGRIQSPHLSSPPFSPFFPCRKHRLTRTQSAFSPVMFSPLFTGEDFGGGFVELWGFFILWDERGMGEFFFCGIPKLDLCGISVLPGLRPKKKTPK